MAQNPRARRTLEPRSDNVTCRTYSDGMEDANVPVFGPVGCTFPKLHPRERVEFITTSTATNLPHVETNLGWPLPALRIYSQCMSEEEFINGW